MQNKAFTLIELLVVIAIIGTLAGIVTVNFVGKTDSARFSTVLSDMKNIETAVLSYYYDNPSGTFPQDVGAGQGPSEIVPEYFSVWPKPPCEGWNYDYDNLNNNNKTVQVTLKKGDGTAVYFYCIYQDPNGGNCSGGQNILDVTDKKLKCV